MSETRAFTNAEVVRDLNQKFCVAVVNMEELRRARFPTVVLVLDPDTDDVLGFESFPKFKRRFPIKLLIDGKLQNAGDVWLNHPQRRQEQAVIFLVKESQSKKKEKCK
jgi:hypothetical protein